MSVPACSQSFLQSCLLLPGKAVGSFEEVLEMALCHLTVWVVTLDRVGLCFFLCGLGVPRLVYKVDLKPVIPWPLPKELLRGRTWILLQKQFVGEKSQVTSAL